MSNPFDWFTRNAHYVFLVSAVVLSAVVVLIFVMGRNMPPPDYVTVPEKGGGITVDQLLEFYREEGVLVHEQALPEGSAHGLTFATVVPKEPTNFNSLVHEMRSHGLRPATAFEAVALVRLYQQKYAGSCAYHVDACSAPEPSFGNRQVCVKQLRADLCVALSSSDDPIDDWYKTMPVQRYLAVAFDTSP